MTPEEKKLWKKEYMRTYYLRNQASWKKYQKTRGVGTPAYNEEKRLKYEAAKESNDISWQKAVNYHRYALAKRSGKDSFTLLDGSICSVWYYSQGIRPTKRKKP